jgi:uncharacterized delta-60 repeat protein
MYLDSTFGNNGTLVDASINSDPINIYFENNNYFLIIYSNSIVCLNYDGSKNVNFANNGILIFNGANETFLTKGSKYWNGFFYIFGQVVYNNSSISKDIFIVKISSAGILDASFGSNGVVKQDFGGDEVLNDVLILENGKTLGIGTKVNSNGAMILTKMILTKYNSNGSADFSFDTNGYKILIANPNESSYGINLFNFENNFLVVGKSSFSLGHNLVLIKIDSNGNYISNFGINGVKQSQIESHPTTASYIVFNASLVNENDLYFGLYVAASFSNQEKTLKKYNISSNSQEDITGLPFNLPFYIVDSNQKIYITGTERCSSNTASNCSRNFNLYRRNTTGTVDTSFNTTGSYSYNFFPSDLISDDMSSALYLHSDGKIFMTGVGYNPFSTNGTGLEMLRITDVQLSNEHNNEINKPSIIPNPVKDELSIENFDNKIIKNIKIFDLLGKQVFISIGDIKKINVSSLQEGVYIAEIKTNEFSYFIKIIKK